MVAMVTNIGSASSTVHYFEQDGYYAKGDPEHRKASFWHGEAARALGLGRHVSPNRFNAILEGHVPGTGLRLGRMRDGGHQHRPGVARRTKRRTVCSTLRTISAPSAPDVCRPIDWRSWR